MANRRRLGVSIGLSGLAAGGAAAAGAVLFQIVKQQGRMMLRIDELERTLSQFAGRPTAPAPSVPLGLPVGSPLDPLTLADLDGNEVSLSDFEGRRLLLVNWSPTCGYCDLIGEDLARVRPGLEAANTNLLLLAHGEAEANRTMADKHGLAPSVLLLGDNSPPGFQGTGTPSAFMVDEHGKVASPLAVGANKVPDLAEEAAASAPANGNGTKSKKLRGQHGVESSRLVRDGLKAGTPAPPIELPDINGEPVSLECLRGRKVLVTFTDPGCGPCEALAPHLVKAHSANGSGPALLLVSRGDVDANRQKAETHGYQFPVVVQDGWKTSKDYGIFETPVAFLVDEDGIIARDVARGVDQVVAMLESVVP